MSVADVTYSCAAVGKLPPTVQALVHAAVTSLVLRHTHFHRQFQATELAFVDILERVRLTSVHLQTVVGEEFLFTKQTVETVYVHVFEMHAVRFSAVEHQFTDAAFIAASHFNPFAIARNTSRVTNSLLPFGQLVLAVGELAVTLAGVMLA